MAKRGEMFTFGSSLESTVIPESRNRLSFSTTPEIASLRLQ